MARGKTNKLAARDDPGRVSGREGAEATGAAASQPRDDRFLALNARFPLRPIRSDEELARAQAMIDSLITRDGLDPAEDDYLDVLGDLVWKYELEHHPLPPVSEADMLRHLIEARGVTQAAVARATGIAEPTISAILSGRRGLSKANIAALARYFHVSPAAFLAG